jgi:DNA-binding response OmpR family regulator
VAQALSKVNLEWQGSPGETNLKCPAGASIVRILIADDNPVFRSVLKVMLTSWGFSVVVACDGAEAWQILQAKDGPRLAILDWLMPCMDGIEVCQLARAAFGRQVYVMILTAKTRSEDLVTAMKAGADDYVTKPFKSQELRFRLAAASRILNLEKQLALFLGPVPAEVLAGNGLVPHTSGRH